MSCRSCRSRFEYRKAAQRRIREKKVENIPVTLPNKNCNCQQRTLYFRLDSTDSRWKSKNKQHLKTSTIMLETLVLLYDLENYIKSAYLMITQVCLLNEELAYKRGVARPNESGYCKWRRSFLSKTALTFIAFLAFQVS